MIYTTKETVIQFQEDVYTIHPWWKGKKKREALKDIFRPKPELYEIV